MLDHIKVVAFDADDTLWVNEPFFRSTEAKFFQILEAYLGKGDFTKELYENEIKNLNLFGYGAKGFMLSMIETALELTQYKMKGEDIQKIINMGKEMLAYPINIYDGVKEVLSALENDYLLICITKGDLLDQESKIARSGLGDYFKKVHVVNEKDPQTYIKILNEYNIDAKNFLMIGNSLKSDILPVVDIGGNAIYIPAEVQWAHEQVKQENYNKEHFHSADSIRDVLNHLSKK